MRSGAVGITLTSADHVFLLEVKHRLLQWGVQGPAAPAPFSPLPLLGSHSGRMLIGNLPSPLQPALNPALEDQAIGRAWRMGQKRPVVVKRLYVQVGR